MEIKKENIRGERLSPHEWAVYFGEVHHSLKTQAQSLLSQFLDAMGRAYKLKIIFADCTHSGWGQLAIKVTLIADN